MPIIKCYNEDYDFKYSKTREDVKGEPLSKSTWYFYLSSNITVLTVENLKNDELNTYQHPSVECEKYGIKMWNKDKLCWLPYISIIQKSYSDYIAEREILIK